jgi:4-alpha-glucanotransferase
MKIDLASKLAGVLIPTFALRTPDDLGIGDTNAMKDAIDFCSRHKIAVLQVLPINETGGDNSPYNAISSVALDPELLTTTPDAIPYLDRDFFAKALAESEIETLREGPVNHPKVKALKLSLLNNAFDNFKAHASTQESGQYAKFKEENKDWLDNYVLFRALITEHDGDARWPLWEPEVQTPEKARAWVEQAEDAEKLKRNMEFWGFVQWLCEKQWLDVRTYADLKSVALMGDIPFGVSRYSADVWSERDLFDLDWSGGAPPETYFVGDIFTAKWGQNWGVPVYRWAVHEKENFAWWRKRIKHLTSIFHYFRIDHVLGFFRVWAFPWIPERNHEFANLTKDEAKELTGGALPHFIPRDDETPEHKELNAAEGKKFLKMTMDAAGSSGIVAEDLGVVPTYCRPLLDELAIPGFYIPLFQRDEEDRSYLPKEEIPRLSLATYGTHDHEPLSTFYQKLVEAWHGPNGDEGWQEIRRLMAFLKLDSHNPPKEFNFELAKALFDTLLSSDCWLGVLMVTDLFGLTQRFNEPGSSSDYNWSQRLSYPLAMYEAKEPYATYIRLYDEAITASDRTPNKKAAIASEKTT